MRRVDLEVNGLSVNALVGSCDPSRLILDFSLDIREVIEATVRDVMKFGPFRAAGSCRGGVGIADRVGSIFIIMDVDELEDEGATSYDATSSRKKVSANNIFENRRFSCRLGANDDLDRWLVR